MKKIINLIVYPFQIFFSRKVAEGVANFLTKYWFMQYVIAFIISLFIMVLMYYTNAS